MRNWGSAENQEWAKGATEVQQHLCDILGNRKWDIFERSEQVYLQDKVGYALFGPPLSAPHRNIGYSKKQLKKMRKVCKAVWNQTKRYTNKDRVKVAFLFVLTNMSDEHLVPVLRMPKYDADVNSPHLFIDSNARVYKGWGDYLKSNKLAKCLMIYPKEGIYSQRDGAVDLDRGRSPGWFSKKTRNALKATNTIVSVGFAGVCIAALFSPVAIPAAPILAGVITRSVLSIGMTIRKLVDRKKHGQTLGLNSQEARGCWVGLVSESLSTATGGVSAAGVIMTKAGQSAFLAGHAGLRALKITSATVDVIGAFNNFTTFAEKVFDDDDITIDDAIQMASSILFFTHAVIPVRIAAGVVKALKDSKLPTILSEMLRFVESLGAQSFPEHEGKSITHIKSAKEFVNLVLREAVEASMSETDSVVEASEDDLKLSEKNKFIRTILTSSLHLKLGKDFDQEYTKPLIRQY